MNDLVDDETLKPITPRGAPAETRAATGDFFSKLIFALCIILVIGALIGSAYGFAGFAENDQGVMHLLSAFALCFGLGGLVFVPAGIIAKYAKTAIKTPLSRGRAIVVLLFTLPWLPFCFYLFRLDGLPRTGALFGLFCAVFIAIWAIRFLRKPAIHS